MKIINNTCIIGVDSGFGNMKTANTIFRTGFTPIDDEPLFGGDVLEYDGHRYLIGAEHKAMVDDKIVDDDYYLLTLVSIAKELSLSGITTADVHIAAGLPLTWVSRQKESFRAYMLRNKHVEFKLNHVAYHINIVGCYVFPQGYAAIVPLMNQPEVSAKFAGMTYLADVGNGTMNIMLLNNGKPSTKYCWTEKLGVNQCVLEVKKRMLDHYGIALNDDVIEQIIRTGKASIRREYLEFILPIVRTYVSGLFDALRSHGYDPRVMHLYVVGGGGCLIQHFGQYDSDEVTINTDLMATAKGYEYLAYGILMGWRKGLAE